MSDEDKDYSAQSRAVIERKRRELERAQEKAEAFEAKLKNFYREVLQDEDVRQSVAQEMINGVRGRASQSETINRIRQKAKSQTGSGYLGDVEDFGNPDNVPTGMENRYWEQDD